MPKKLVDCVKKVKRHNPGKPEKFAWAVCTESTGLKPHRKRK
jgi:hypothetical protein